MNNFSIQVTPSKVLKELAVKIRYIRRQKKISQTELASRSGVSLGSLKRFETTGKISMESFLKLLLILGRLNEMEEILHPEDDIKRLEKLFSDKTRR